MLRSYRRWLDSLDPAERQVAAGSLTPWLQATVLATALMALAAYAPGARELIGLRFVPAALAYLPALCVALLGHFLDRHGGLTQAQYGLDVLATSTALHFYTAALVVFSQPPGAAYMAVFLIMAAAYHGHLYKVTPARPFLALGTALAVLGAIALRPEYAGILLIAGTAAVGGAFLLGTIAAYSQHERREQEALREAVHAQMLDESTRDVSQLSDALLRLLQANHDAGNALTAALFEAQAVADRVCKRSQGDARDEELLRASGELLRALLRLQGLVEEAADAGRGRGEGALPVRNVAPLPVVAQVARRVGLRHPHVRIAVPEPGRHAPKLRAALCGGEASLDRILENLVLNACEGDGERGAGNVEIAVRESPGVGALVVQVRDDGPGFDAAALAAPITGFRTTKAHGTGLGLYTAERLVRASGGSLRRENRSGGGALVSVFLRGTGAG